MKINKKISKLLIMSLFVSNFSILSNATSNLEIPNRYQMLEGEYITIDDSTEGELTEIEVFGNTIQDENNLEDIQSVGDLYVDENGNPILDNQGREQYKIDIEIANGFNLINLNSDLWTIEGVNSGDCMTNYVIPVKPNTIYTYKQNKESWRGIYQTTEDGVQIKVLLSSMGKDYVFTTPSDCYFIQLYAGVVHNDLTQPLKREMQLYEGTKSLPFTKEVMTKTNKTTILLPTQLQKVGDVADRLYWDDEKGRYVIEKNIKKTTIDKNSSFRKMTYLNTDIFATTISDMVATNDTAHVSSNNRVTSVLNAGIEDYIGYTYNSVSANNSEIRFIEALNTTTDDFVLDRIGEDIINILYILKTPEIIETDITSKLKIPTYDGKTYIYAETENGISPTLKVTVDRLPQIAKNSVEEAETNSISANISLARMYVNMLPESTYKDQLQEQLTQLFSSDMVLDRKTATANLDLYIKSENMLSMTLSTNSVTFEDYSGVDDLEQSNAIKIDINSSLPYQLNAYLIDEIYNIDKDKKIDIDRLNIKDSDDINYKEFTDINEKLVLKDDCSRGNDLSHNIDLKLKGGEAYPADIYKTVIKFEAEQK